MCLRLDAPDRGGTGRVLWRTLLTSPRTDRNSPSVKLFSLLISKNHYLIFTNINRTPPPGPRCKWRQRNTTIPGLKWGSISPSSFQNPSRGSDVFGIGKRNLLSITTSTTSRPRLGGLPDLAKVPRNRGTGYLQARPGFVGLLKIIPVFCFLFLLQTDGAYTRTNWNIVFSVATSGPTSSLDLNSL